MVHRLHTKCRLTHGEETRVWGDQAYRGQTEVIRECAPQAQDCTHRRYRYKEVKRHLVCKRWTIEKADENSNGIPWFVLHRPNSDKLRFHLPSLPWHWFDA